MNRLRSVTWEDGLLTNEQQRALGVEVGADNHEVVVLPWMS